MSANPLKPAEPPKNRPIVLAACLVAIFMTAVEATIVATAMPSIIADLGGFELFGWVFAVYVLAQAITIPLYGRLADLHGRKPVFYFGAALFLGGSALCGVAHGMIALIVYRTIQGLGAGAVQSIALTVVGDLYSPVERVKIQGYLASVWGMSAVIGPLLGAFIVDHLGWPVVFWVNLPIGLVAIVMLTLFHRELVRPRRHAIDWIGAVLLAISIGTLMLVMLQGDQLGRWIPALLGAAAISTAALVVQQRRAPEPILPMVLWRNRVVVVGNLGSLITGALMMGVSAFLPPYTQGVRGEDTLTAGILLALMMVGWPIATILGARLTMRTSYRASALVGVGFLLLGASCLLILDPTSSLAWAGAGSFLLGAGLGFCTNTFMVSTQGAVDLGSRGVATSSILFTRLVGQAAGMAVFGGILNRGIAARLPEGGDPIQHLIEPALRQALSPTVLGHLTTAISASLHDVFLAGAIMAALTLPVVLAMPARLRPGHTDPRPVEGSRTDGPAGEPAE
ncbi:MAG TPA: MDR family MFS transporter [Stellaceae bacterium]|nr:MDR family MFS transporter [Stellaceae bacterium]